MVRRHFLPPPRTTGNGTEKSEDRAGYLPQQEADESQQQQSGQDGQHHDPQGGALVHLQPCLWIYEELKLWRTNTIR